MTLDRSSAGMPLPLSVTWTATPSGHGLGSDPNSRRDTGASVGHGILDEVLQERAQLFGVGVQGEIGNLYFRPGVRQAESQVLFNVVDQCREGHRAGPE